VTAPDGELVTRLRIEGGALALGSLHCPGFASTATPDFEALQPLAMPQSFTAV
jgi:hypothetical protein